MKSQLHKLQEDFVLAIREKNTDAISHLPINSTNGISKETRLEVYNYAYWSRIGGSLKEDFPSLVLKLGNNFEKTLRDFIKKCKPGHHLLGEVSISFCEFIIKTHPDLSAEASRDLAILLSESSAWTYFFEESENLCITPERLVVADPNEVQLLWNTSLYQTENQIVFQKSEETEITSVNQTILDILNKRQQLKTLTELLNFINDLQLNESETSSAIAFLTQNEILYFTIKN